MCRGGCRRGDGREKLIEFENSWERRENLEKFEKHTVKKLLCCVVCVVCLCVRLCVSGPIAIWTHSGAKPVRLGRGVCEWPYCHLDSLRSKAGTPRARCV